jgi:single-strand DNA-binding protein
VIGGILEGGGDKVEPQVEGETVNVVELEGAVVREPELKYLPSGKQLVEFTLVTNDVRWDKEKGESVPTSTFHVCTIWGELADEFVEQVRRSDRVYVKGSLDRRAIEKDGKKEEKTRVNVLFWQPTMVHPRPGPRHAAPTPVF